MNKYFNALIFATTLFLGQTTICATTAPAAFAKLAPKISKDAQAWVQEVKNTLSEELQLTWLNFLAFVNIGQPTRMLIKCSEHIESIADMLPISQSFTINIIQILQEYHEKIEEKISRKKDLTDEEEDKLLQQLETKIKELLTYINEIYYEALYSHVAQKGSSAPLYMFDENGIIAKEKRTQRLPLPQ